MKIKLSKSRWEGIGRKAGWMKKAESKTPAPQQPAQLVSSKTMKKEAVQSLIDPKRPKIMPSSKIQYMLNVIITGLQNGFRRLQEEEKRNPNLTPEDMAQILAMENGLNLQITQPIVEKALKRPDGAAHSVEIKAI